MWAKPHVRDATVHKSHNPNLFLVLNASDSILENEFRCFSTMVDMVVAVWLVIGSRSFALPRSLCLVVCCFVVFLRFFYPPLSVSFSLVLLRASVWMWVVGWLVAFQVVLSKFACKSHVRFVQMIWIWHLSPILLNDDINSVILDQKIGAILRSTQLNYFLRFFSLFSQRITFSLLISTKKKMVLDSLVVFWFTVHNLF